MLPSQRRALGPPAVTHAGLLECPPFLPENLPPWGPVWGWALGLPARPSFLLCPPVSLCGPCRRILFSCLALSLTRVSSVGAHVAFLLTEGASVSWLRSAAHCDTGLCFSGMLDVFLLLEVGTCTWPQRGGQQPSSRRPVPRGPSDGLYVAVLHLVPVPRDCPSGPVSAGMGIRVGAQGPASPPSRAGLGCWSLHPAGRRVDCQEWVPGARHKTDGEGVPADTWAGLKVSFFRYSS